MQQFTAEHRFHGMLHIPAQGPGTKLRVICLIHNECFGFLRQLNTDLLDCKAFIQFINQKVNDPGYIFLRQGLVEDNLIQSV